ncbi:protein-export chaperone SecB [Enterococcus bulliens]
MEGPVIVFENYKLNKYNFERKDNTDHQETTQEKEKDNVSLSVETGTTEDLKSGRVTVNVEVQNEEMKLNIEVSGFFSINVETSVDEITEFLTVNGTAIVFPYIRSMVSMLTSLDSSQALILPTINTQNLLNK